MAGTKTTENTQFGRVLADLATAVPSADNTGREPSVTPEGAIWVKIDGALLPVPVPLPVIPPQFATKTYYSSGAVLGTGLIFTGACDIINLFGGKAANSALRYLQIFDSIVAPLVGAIPNISIPLPGSNATFSLTYPVLPQVPRQFATGIYFAISTTQATYTVSANGFVWLNAEIGS